MNELSTVFSENHLTIAEQCMKKVVGMLSQEGCKPITYAIDNEYSERESLKIQVNDKTTIELSIRTAR